MGDSQPSILSTLHLKDMVLESKGAFQSSSGTIWHKAVEFQGMKKKLNKGGRIKKRYGVSFRRNLVMEKTFLEGSRRSTNGVERKVRTLKKLLPNGKSMELDGLFKEAGDYIVSLEMQVKVMQILVKVLSDSYV